MFLKVAWKTINVFGKFNDYCKRLLLKWHLFSFIWPQQNYICTKITWEQDLQYITTEEIYLNKIG